MEHAYAWAWSSFVEGDEGCIGRSGKLLCLWSNQKKYTACMEAFLT